jgi:trypsin
MKFSGKEITLKDAPYMAQVVANKLTGRNFCGGSIIAINFILTAGHCVEGTNETDLMVRVGTKHREASGNLYRVLKTIPYPKFNSTINLSYDIALLKLGFNIQLVPGVKEIIPLASTNEWIPDNSMALVSGWGLTKNAGESNARIRGVEVPIVSQAECKKAWQYLIDEMICAGVPDGGKSSCNGEIRFKIKVQDDVFFSF